MSLTALFIIFTSTALVSATSPPPAYEILQQFNFPVGLLPKGATSYKLNNSTGEFNVYFNDTCRFSLQGSYELRYEPSITGFISKDKLSKLQGVSVKVVVLWMNIVEVRHVSDKLEFFVGFTSKNFPIGDFDECPQCGCGFDCDESEETKIELDRVLASS